MLRQFSGLWLGFFGVMALWQAFVRERVWLGLVLSVVACGVGLAGLAWPRLVRPIFVGWMILAFPIGWTLSHVLFGLLFFGVFTSLSLFFRMTGRDALQLQKPEARESYWQPKPAAASVRQYFRQF